MTLETMQAAIDILKANGINASLEYPGVIFVTLGKYSLWCGTANETWDADIYTGDVESPDEAGVFTSDLPSTCEDPSEVARVTLGWVEQIKEIIAKEGK